MIDIIIHSNDTNWGHVWHIVTTDGKGMINAQIEDDDNDTIYFHGLSVTPDKRRQGIGTELVDDAEKLGKELGRKRFRLNIDKPYKDWLYDYYINLGYEYWDEDEYQVYFIKYNNE